MQKSSENIVPFMKKRADSLRILVVDDDELQRDLMGEHIARFGHSMLPARNGEHALALLQKNPADIDVVLMDFRMPVMDGLSAVRRMKEYPELRNTPVVMVSGAASQQEMQEGLEAGVLYYLSKPVDENILRSVLIAVARDVQQSSLLNEGFKRHKSGFSLIQTCKFKFSTMEEAECLASFAAQCFPDPRRVLPGLGELLINAVEHGNLEIGYDRKTHLLNEDLWHAEIRKRQDMEDYKDRVVDVALTHKDEGIYVIITDQGRGFEWKRYLMIDPARAGDNHGRGIAQARAMSFDRLSFNETGNQAVGFVGTQKPLEW
ncbi:MAG: response regulator [Alphaproteobacteria bacterium]|nr:response regulator [Alphaproteobacteria bacterium]